jgi:hypothetical protein
MIIREERIHSHFAQNVILIRNILPMIHEHHIRTPKACTTAFAYATNLVGSYTKVPYSHGLLGVCEEIMTLAPLESISFAAAVI